MIQDGARYPVLFVIRLRYLRTNAGALPKLEVGEMRRTVDQLYDQLPAGASPTLCPSSTHSCTVHCCCKSGCSRRDSAVGTGFT